MFDLTCVKDATTMVAAHLAMTPAATHLRIRLELVHAVPTITVTAIVNPDPRPDARPFTARTIAHEPLYSSAWAQVLKTLDPQIFQCPALHSSGCDLDAAGHTSRRFGTAWTRSAQEVVAAVTAAVTAASERAPAPALT